MHLSAHQSDKRTGPIVRGLIGVSANVDTLLLTRQLQLTLSTARIPGTAISSCRIITASPCRVAVVIIITNYTAGIIPRRVLRDHVFLVFKDTEVSLKKFGQLLLKMNCHLNKTKSTQPYLA
ncbi:GSCOCG00001971001-RA-CDS [Cotesia congregata]|nr:GSCOCG00001971001-RA-CDS [Cotesia congregata]